MDSVDGTIFGNLHILKLLLDLAKHKLHSCLNISFSLFNCFSAKFTYAYIVHLLVSCTLFLVCSPQGICAHLFIANSYHSLSSAEPKTKAYRVVFISVFAINRMRVIDEESSETTLYCKQLQMVKFSFYATLTINRLKREPWAFYWLFPCAQSPMCKCSVFTGAGSPQGLGMKTADQWRHERLIAVNY